MPTLEKRLEDYLERITGGAVSLREVSGNPLAGLPLFLRERYEFRRIVLFGRDCLLALEKPGLAADSPAEAANHARTMLAQLGEPVTLVLGQVASYARNRMVQAGAPFIVPGSQVFMPFMMVDLRERFKKPGPEEGLPLTPAAQSILFYHLLRKPLQGQPLHEIAKLTGYSPMMATKVKDEWAAHGLCQTVRSGRSVVVEFTASGRGLWQKAKPLLSSPVKKSHWLRWTNPGPPALAAGYTALSRIGMTEDDPIPTRALFHRTYREMFNRGDFQLAEGQEDADARIEAWSYDPRLLSDGPSVDPLSLVLSLSGDLDERVQQQLETVLNRAFSTEP